MLAACDARPPARPPSPPGFPWHVALQGTALTTTAVTVTEPGSHTFVLPDGRLVVQGRRWSGRVAVADVQGTPATFLVALTQPMVERIGWEVVLHEPAGRPPRMTLRRTRGGEILWAEFAGTPDDLAITVVHRHSGVPDRERDRVR